MSRGPSLGSSIRVNQQFVSTEANMYESLALYIDGEFIAGGGRREQDVHNPASGASNRYIRARLLRDFVERSWARMNKHRAADVPETD